MFEPKHPFAADHAARDPEAGPQAELRAVSWSELNARLSAARELRNVLASSEPETAASFDAEFARHVAHLHEAHEEERHDAVNRDDLANGKGAGGNTDGTDEEPRPASRGIA